MNRALALVALVASACGGSSVSIDDFYAQQLKTRCTFIVDCCASTGGPTYASVDACVQANSNASAVAAAKAQVSAGTAMYDGSAASSCLSKSKSLFASCAGTISRTAEDDAASACNDALHGTAQAGASCAFASDSSGSPCDVGLYCNVTIGTSGTTGTCTAYASSGQDCTNTECGGMTFCDESSNTCKPLGGTGAACAADDECASYACDSASATCSAASSSPVTDLCPAPTP